MKIQPSLKDILSIFSNLGIAQKSVFSETRLSVTTPISGELTNTFAVSRVNCAAHATEQAIKCTAFAKSKNFWMTANASGGIKT